VTVATAPRDLVGAVASRGITQAGSRAVSLVLQTVTFGVVAHLLGPSELGPYAVALAAAGVLGAVADLGLATTAVVEIGRRADPRSVVRETLAASVAVAVVATAAAVAVISVLYPGRILTAFLVLVPWVIAGRITACLASLRQAEMAFGRLALADVAGRVATVAVVAFAATLDPGSPTARLVWVGASAVAGAVLTGVVTGHLDLVRPARITGGWPAVWRLVVLASPLGLVNLCSMLHGRLDQLLLGAIRPGELAGYAVAYRVLDGLVAVVAAAGAVCLGALVRAPRGDWAGLTHRTTRLVAVLSGIAALFAAVAAVPLVSILAGSEFAESGTVLRLLVPTVVISALNVVPASVLIASGATRRLLRIAAATVATNLALNALLIPAAGARGAAVATVLSELLGYLMVRRAARSCLDA
jgi:O-antigen/teichoic acid export membrane protein